MAEKIIIVDDQYELVDGLRVMLQEELPEVEIETFTSSLAALERARKEQVDLVLTDMRMPAMDGFQFLDELKKLDYALGVVVMTAYGGIETAVQAVKRGAYDFICKPFEFHNLLQSLNNGLENTRLIRKNIKLRRRRSDRTAFADFVGETAPMQRFYDNIRAVARANYTVLIRGESGTGKELTARAIHQESGRRDANLVMVNCPAIPEQLLESQLFGHKKGAFTGADRDYKGLFVEAGGGTICLDEIGDIPLSVQVKLLRVLQDGEIRPLGANKTIKLDVRVLASTNQNLEKKIEQGLFREDLFYRLNVVTIYPPRLSDIRDDIPHLMEHFAKMTCAEQGVDMKIFRPEFIEEMMKRSWPGNVRQLQNMIRRAVIFSPGDEIGLESIKSNNDFPDIPESGDEIMADLPGGVTYKEAKAKIIKKFSCSYMDNLLRRTDGNVSKAAGVSGLSRAAFQKIMNRYKISPAQFRH
ncbi:MAG TPA: sigma-54-dependent Fis family transcriptional regulator [Desulfobacterales bacterium]|nr:sigma-54-dependent Fis family transcriptional regulator [Desulfobacterales bacterium]